MCKKQHGPSIINEIDQSLSFSTNPPKCRKRRPSSKSVAKASKLLIMTSRHWRSVRNNTIFNKKFDQGLCFLKNPQKGRKRRPLIYIYRVTFFPVMWHFRCLSHHDHLGNRPIRLRDGPLEKWWRGGWGCCTCKVETFFLPYGWNYFFQ